MSDIAQVYERYEIGDFGTVMYKNVNGSNELYEVTIIAIRQQPLIVVRNKIEYFVGRLAKDVDWDNYYLARCSAVKRTSTVW